MNKYFYSSLKIFGAVGITALLMLFFAIYTNAYSPASGQYTQIKNVKTSWKLSPSFKYDTICFLNVLTGDPYYTRRYAKEWKEFEPKLTPKVRESLANLKRVIKEERKLIISAATALYFSATDDESLSDMLSTLDNSETMRANLKQSSFYNEEGWQVYLTLRKDFRIVFRFLKDIKFHDYWKINILPKVRKTISEIEADLPRYDVISEVEKHTEKKFGSNKITVYMLYFSRPHGIRITGTRFLTDIAWSFSILLRTATHEMLHPPFSSDDKELVSALDSFKKDSFVMDKVLNHNPSFGYNSFNGYIDENVTKAIDQIINEKLGIASDARMRFKHSDDGMHVFAATLYSVMKKEGFPIKGESLRSFLLRIIRSGKFAPGKTKLLYEEFYSKEAGQKR